MSEGNAVPSRVEIVKSDIAELTEGSNHFDVSESPNSP